MARKILFVDDEQSVLDALRRMLRPFRQEWKVLVAGSGDDAIRVLEETPVDVLVSDMQMPGMDGAQLLRHVATHHPETIRMILTGYSSKRALLDSVGSSHQLLVKPCNADLLVATLQRAVALRERLNDPHLRGVVAAIDCLPSLPALYLQLVEALARGASSQAIGGLIGQDLAMSTRVLQLVNSAFFGLRRPIGDPVQATSFLGVELIRALTLSAHLFQELSGAAQAGLDLERLQTHAQFVGTLARHMVRGQELPDGSDDLAYLSGLLHETGLLILGQSHPELLRSAHEEAFRTGTATHVLERSMIGAGHAEVGAYLLGLWGLPDVAVEAVAFHDDYALATTRGFDVAAAVYLANRIVNRFAHHSSDPPNDSAQPDLEEVAERLGVPEQLEGWLSFADRLSTGAS